MRQSLFSFPYTAILAALTLLPAITTARESCNAKDVAARIAKHTAEPSPIYNCQADFSAAKNCCLYPERCTHIAAHQNIQESFGALGEYKKLKQNELQQCETKIKAAKLSCENDSVRLKVLQREFNDIILCADDNLARLNGRMVKSASDNRFAYEAPPERKPDSDRGEPTPQPATPDLGGPLDLSEPSYSGLPAVTEAVDRHLEAPADHNRHSRGR